jgi:hypothetical protein
MTDAPNGSACSLPHAQGTTDRAKVVLYNPGAMFFTMPPAERLS